MILAPDAVRLFYSNAYVTKCHTEIALEGVNNPHHAQAVESYLGYRSSGEFLRAQSKVKRMTRSEMGNLPHAIVLACGKPYMLTLNIDVKDRLVNGAVGVLQEL